MRPDRSGDSRRPFAVWYQTDRLVMQEEDGEPWNREVIRSLLRCSPLEFKTVRVTVFLNDGPPVAQIGGTLDDTSEEPWRTVIPDSVDQASMRGACDLIRDGREAAPAPPPGHGRS